MTPTREYPVENLLPRLGVRTWRGLKITDRRVGVFVRNTPAMLGLVLIMIILLLAVFADHIAPYGYDRISLQDSLQFPNATHWLGTDLDGRDEFSRLMYGARISFAVSFTVLAVAFGVGIPLGAAAGWYGGRVDYVVTRLLEVMTAFPGFLFALVLMSILGAGFVNLIIAIGITSWIEPCRQTRAQFLALREREFITAARSYGATDARLIARHLLPHTVPMLLVMFVLGVPGVMFAEAGLSYLGMGINDPLPSWGKMVNEGLGYLHFYWYLALFPTLAISLTMLAFSFVAEGLSTALTPRELN